MNNRDERMSIVVVSCDNYKDIVKYYLYFVEQNWSDCPYDILIATETYDHKSDIAHTIMCGDGTPWAKCAAMAVQSCDSPYILMTVDDLFISKKVDSNAFNGVLDFIQANDINYYRIPIISHNGRHKGLFKHEYPTHPDNANVACIPTNEPYGRTIGSSIWERNELLNFLGDGMKNAWELEDAFCKEASSGKRGVYYEKYFTDKRDLLHSVEMISNKRWDKYAVNRMKALGYEIDCSKRGFLPNSMYRRRKIYGLLGKICPVKMRAPVKKVLRKVGFKFVTNN